MRSQAVSAEQALMLLGPMLALLFALCFIWLWRRHGRQRCMLLLAGAFACFSCGASLQALSTAYGVVVDNTLAGTCYLLSAWLLGAGFVRRARVKNFSAAIYAMVFVTIVATQYYFYYVNPQLAVRLHLLSFGCGLMLLLAWTRTGALRHGTRADQALYWVYTCFMCSLFVYLTAAAGAAPGNEVSSFDVAAAWAVTQLTSAIFIVVLSVLLLIAVFEEKMSGLRRDRDHDILTAILNRRGFVSRAQPALNRRTASSSTASLLLLDLDEFKRINDSYSHAVGDAVLAGVGQIIRCIIRSGDIAGRIGGEEFAILLPETDLSGAHELAERIRTTLAGAKFPGVPPTDRVTASIGVASGRLTDTLYSLMDRADGLLYEAKKFGRDRVMLTA